MKYLQPMVNILQWCSTPLSSNTFWWLGSGQRFLLPIQLLSKLISLPAGITNTFSLNTIAANMDMMLRNDDKKKWQFYGDMLKHMCTPERNHTKRLPVARRLHYNGCKSFGRDYPTGIFEKAQNRLW